MELYLNHNKPLVMHIDLNSCFATVEQQVYCHLRGKPIVVSAYTISSGCVLSPAMYGEFEVTPAIMRGGEFDAEPDCLWKRQGA